MEIIDLDLKLEYKGYWWLPSNPDKRVAGVLYPNEKIVLELLGCCVLSLYGFDNSRINEIMKESNSKVLQL